MAEKEGKNINTALKGVLGDNDTLIGLVGGNVRQIETDVSGGLMSFDEGVSKSDIDKENGVTGFYPIGEVKEHDKRAVSGSEVKNYLKNIEVEQNFIPNNDRLNSSTELISNYKAGDWEIRFQDEFNSVSKNSDFFSIVLSNENNQGDNPAFWLLNKINLNLSNQNLRLEFDIKADVTFQIWLNVDNLTYQKVDITSQWKRISLDVIFNGAYGDMRIMLYRRTTGPGSVVKGTSKFDIRNISLNYADFNTKSVIEKNSSDVIDLQNKLENIYNDNILKNFIYKTASSNSLANIGFYGDSWTDGVPNAINYVRDLALKLRDKFGNGGGGWYDFSMSQGQGTTQKMGCAISEDASDTRVGNFTYKDQTADCKGINQSETLFLKDAKITLTTNNSQEKLVIHYFGEEGDVWRYRLNDGEFIYADIVNGYNTIDINCIGEVNILEIENTGFDAIILGVDMQKSKGVRVNKFGNRGLKAVDFDNIDKSIWETALSKFNLDTITYMIGTNDRTQGVELELFNSSVSSWVNSVFNTDKYIDIALIGQSNNKDKNRNFTISSYNSELRDVARDKSIPFLNLLPLFGSSDNLIAKNTFFDNLHPTEQGGSMISEYMFKKLLDN